MYCILTAMLHARIRSRTTNIQLQNRFDVASATNYVACYDNCIKIVTLTKVNIMIIITTFWFKF